MAFVTGLRGLSGRRLPFGRPYLGVVASPAAARAEEAIATAVSRRDEALLALKRAQGLARAIERNQSNLTALLGLEKAQGALSEAHVSLARSRAEYEQASVEVNAARVAAGLTRLEI